MRTINRTLTPLALAVLRLLRERPMHPYEMQQTIRDRATDRVVKVRAGSLYHTIERLARSGAIEPVEVGREGRRPERTVYAITETGRDAYLRDLRELVRQPEQEFPVFAAAVEMLTTLDRDDAIELLEARIIQLEARLAAHDQAIASLTKRGLPRSSTLEIEYTQAVWRAEVEWVRHLIDDIHSGTLPWPQPDASLTPSAKPDPGVPVRHEDHDAAASRVTDAGAGTVRRPGSRDDTGARPQAPDTTDDIYGAPHGRAGRAATPAGHETKETTS